MPYKRSRFSFSYTRNDDTHVVYNTYSKALVVLTEKEFREYEALQFEDQSVEKELVDNGILLEESFDEKAFMSYCHNVTKFSKGALHLVLATTMYCDFGCPYCYENRRKGWMGEEVQNAIIRFIEKQIDEGTKELDVTWYGREPLLYPDIVRNLAARIRQVF